MKFTYDPKRARPARLVEKVNDDVREEPEAVGRAAHLVLVSGGVTNDQ